MARSATQELLHDPVPGAAGSALAYLGRGFYQVAFVTPDLPALTRTLQDDAGVAAFHVIPDAQVQDQTLRGGPCDARQDLAFGYAGHLQFEVIQPLSGESTYSEFLGSHPGGGVHHLGVLVDDYDTAVADMSAHHQVAQTGRVGDTRFAYLDLTAQLGVYIELFQLGDDFLDLFESIRRQDTAS